MTNRHIAVIHVCSLHDKARELASQDEKEPEMLSSITDITASVYLVILASRRTRHPVGTLAASDASPYSSIRSLRTVPVTNAEHRPTNEFRVTTQTRDSRKRRATQQRRTPTSYVFKAASLNHRTIMAGSAIRAELRQPRGDIADSLPPAAWIRNGPSSPSVCR